VLSKSRIDHFYLKIVQYDSEEENSLSIFFKDLIKKLNLKNQKDLLIKINSLKINGGKLNLVNSQSKKEYVITNINVNFDKIIFKDNNFDAIIQDAQLFYKKNKLESLKSKINYSNGIAKFDKLELSTKGSRIRGGIKFKLNDQSFDIGLDKIKLSHNEISELIKTPIVFDTLSGSLKLNGTLDDLVLSKLELFTEDLYFLGGANFKKIVKNKPEIKAEIKKLNLSSNLISQILKSYSNNRIIQKIGKIGKVEVTGSINLSKENYLGNIFLLSERGNISSITKAEIKTNNEDLFVKKMSCNLRFEDFYLGNIVDGAGDLNGDFYLTGHGPISKVYLGDSKGFIKNINLFSNKYENINLKTQKLDDGYKNQLIIEDNNVQFDFSIISKLKNDVTSHEGLFKIKKIDLNHFSSNLGDGTSNLSGNLLIDYYGDKIDNLSGVLNFKDFIIEKGSSKYNFSNFLVENNFIDSYRKIEIKNSNSFSGKIEGNYYISDAINLLSNFINEVYPFSSEKKLLKDQDISFNFGIKSNFLKTLYPKIKSDKETIIEGIISSSKNSSKLNLFIPNLFYNNLDVYGLKMIVDTSNPDYNTTVSIDEINNQNYQIRGFYSSSIKLNDELNINLSFEEGVKFKNKYSINSNYSFHNGKSFLEIGKSKILFKENLWSINDSNTSILSYDHIRKKIELDLINAKIDEEEISFSGSYKSSKDFDLFLEVDNLSINKISPEFPRFNLQGKLNTSIELKRSLTDNTLKIEIEGNDFQINNNTIGDILVSSSGNTQMNSYGIDLMVKKDKLKTLTGKGSLLGIDMNPRLDIDLIFNQFNIDFLSPLGRENIKNIRGEINGEVNLWGPIESPYHTGKLELNNSGLKINYTNTDYGFVDGAEISLVNQSFNIKNTKFIDTKFETEGFVSGKIEHVNFKNWNFDLNINSEKIMMIDIPRNDEAIFYGNGFFKGNVNLTGPSKNLNINVVGETQEGTIINIPWADDYGIVDPSFIEFKDKSKPSNIFSNKINSKNFQGIEMNFELDIDSDAEIAIVIDNETGSFLKGKGGGNVLMEINTKGKFNIWGDYVVSEGVYNFKNLSLIDKKFTLKPGGTIGWEGDPYLAIMDLEAIYKVPGGANPALLLDNPNFNKKIPTEVIIKLQGNLLKPDDPIFQINFPNASGVVKSEINYRLSDPQISQLQAISLLSQGIFISEVSVSIQGITNNLYEKASDVFSDLIGSDEGKLIFGVNYLQGDKSEYLDFDSEDRLGLTLSTQITDKILINGEIGVPVGGMEETLIVGDVQIDFILNEDGSLKAKVFNKENEFRYIGDDLGYTQGIGVSYEVDFETFSELLSKIIKRKK